MQPLLPNGLEHFHHPNNIPYAIYLFPVALISRATTNLLSLSIEFPFSGCGIIQFLATCIQLLLLSVIFLIFVRVIHISVVCYFLLMNRISYRGHTTFRLFIYLLVDISVVSIVWLLPVMLP